MLARVDIHDIYTGSRTNLYSQNGIWTKWYEKMILDKMVWTKWYI